MVDQLTTLKRSLPVMLALTVMSLNAYAQELSRDGNRWYEIEISIFTNQALNVQGREQSFPENLDLSYPDEIRQLQASTSSYTYDFTLSESLPLTVTDPSALQPLPQIGALYSPSSSTFRVSNFNTDAFISLGQEHQQFLDINQSINRSPEHRLLYHAVWRQPMPNKVQASAMFIRGGDNYGSHNELEGSITISFNTTLNRVDIDSRLWLNSFMSKINNEESLWAVPQQVFELSEADLTPGFANEFYIEEVAMLDETREMRSNELHYLDHPAFGLLIQIRPYLLPDNLDFEP